jgi:hypothetical protein
MMKALHRGEQGLCKVVEVTLDGIHPTGETTRILGWGDLDGTAEVYEADSGAYEILIPIRERGA